MNIEFYINKKLPKLIFFFCIIIYTDLITFFQMTKFNIFNANKSFGHAVHSIHL